MLLREEDSEKPDGFGNQILDAENLDTVLSKASLTIPLPFDIAREGVNSNFGGSIMRSTLDHESRRFLLFRDPRSPSFGKMHKVSMVAYLVYHDAGRRKVKINFNVMLADE